MKKLLYYFSLITLLTTLSYSDYYKESLTLDPDRLNEEVITTVEDDYIENPLFIYAGVGASYYNVKTNVQSDKLVGGAINKIASTAELGLGLRVDKDIFMEAFMQKSYLSEASITNIGISANYQFEQLYLGLLGGESRLIWEHSPVINTLSEDKEQKQIFYGLQFGHDFELLHRLSIYTKYQFMFVNHKTDINNDSTIKHNIQNNLTTGVKYAF